MKDTVYNYNKTRWEELVDANALFTRPWLDLDVTSARLRVDPRKLLGPIEGKSVLCLAAGGGQQSAAFAILGATVTVLDISDGQLARDRHAATHYNKVVRTIQGDMRNLSELDPSSFDLVSQPYSLNFVPDCREVFREVAKVLRADGRYTFWAANPFFAGIGTKDWNGCGYTISLPYVQGKEMTYKDEDWVFAESAGKESTIQGPREYRQCLSTIVNGLNQSGFVIEYLNEETGFEPGDPSEPGTWYHLTEVAPPWLSFVARLSKVSEQKR